MLAAAVLVSQLGLARADEPATSLDSPPNAISSPEHDLLSSLMQSPSARQSAAPGSAKDGR